MRDLLDNIFFVTPRKRLFCYQLEKSTCLKYPFRTIFCLGALRAFSVIQYFRLIIQSRPIQTGTFAFTEFILLLIFLPTLQETWFIMNCWI